MPDNDSYGEKGVYRTRDSKDWMTRVRSAASMGLPLEVLADGLQKMISDGSMSSSDASKYEMFFRLVGLGKVALGKNPKNAEDLYEVIFSVAKELPDTSPDGMYRETVSSLDGIANDSRLAGVNAVLVDEHVDINALPSMSLEDFKKYVKERNIRAVAPPYNPVEVSRITGVSQSSVESYIVGKGFSQSGSVALTWGDVVSIARRDGINENKMILNIADYVGATISDRNKYSEKGFRKVSWNQLRYELQTAKLDFYDALSVSRGWLSKRDLLSVMPTQDWQHRMPPHTPYFTLHRIRELIEKKHGLPQCRMRDVRESMIVGYCRVKGVEYYDRNAPDANVPTPFEQVYKTERERRIAHAISESIPHAQARALRKADYAIKRGNEIFNAPEARKERARKAKETRAQNKRAREIGEAVGRQQDIDNAESVKQLDLFFGGDGTAFEKKENL